SRRLDPLGAAGRRRPVDLYARGRAAGGMEIRQPGRAHVKRDLSRRGGRHPRRLGGRNGGGGGARHTPGLYGLFPGARGPWGCAVKALAFLRKPEQALADRYLDATVQYLDMYRGLLGPYPYSKFALVENFWETGYGMPSFTLLGEQVIRFPFILHSSYPHELLHNWWGNGVFVDLAGGNWCEGLTAYLADHLIAEQRGQGAEHRRAILQRVTDYVTPENDFPLTRFLSRHNAVTEAVGYGKTAMVFNML